MRRSLEQRLDQMSVTMDQRELKVGDQSLTYGTLVPKAPPPETGYPVIVGLHYGTWDLFGEGKELSLIDDPKKMKPATIRVRFGEPPRRRLVL